jgi:hypothetical protein
VAPELWCPSFENVKIEILQDRFTAQAAGNGAGAGV